MADTARTSRHSPCLHTVPRKRHFRTRLVTAVFTSDYLPTGRSLWLAFGSAIAIESIRSACGARRCTCAERIIGKPCAVLQRETLDSETATPGLRMPPKLTRRDIRRGQSYLARCCRHAPRGGTGLVQRMGRVAAPTARRIGWSDCRSAGFGCCCPNSFGTDFRSDLTVGGDNSGDSGCHTGNCSSGPAGYLYD